MDYIRSYYIVINSRYDLIQLSNMKDVLERGISYNRIDILMFIFHKYNDHDNIKYIKIHGLVYAMEHNKYAIIDCYITNELLNNNMILSCAYSGNKVKYVKDKGIKCFPDSSMFYNAIHKANYNMVIEFLEAKIDVTQEHISMAIRDRDMLDIFVKYGHLCTMASAIMLDRLDIVKKLKRTASEEEMRIAIEFKRIDIIEYLHSIGSTYSNIISDDLDIINILGLNITEETFIMAIKNNNHELVSRYYSGIAPLYMLQLAAKCSPESYKVLMGYN